MSMLLEKSYVVNQIGGTSRSWCHTSCCCFAS